MPRTSGVFEKSAAKRRLSGVIAGLRGELGPRRARDALSGIRLGHRCDDLAYDGMPQNFYVLESFDRQWQRRSQRQAR